MERSELLTGARVLAQERLVTAFGHISRRVDERHFEITPGRPLGSLTAADPLVTVSLDEGKPPGPVPGEFWLHWAIYRLRPDVKAICRAQPEVATALAATGVRIRPLHGQGAFLGREVPIYDDARLIRSQDLGEALAERLGDARALLMRGNGAVTVGSSVGEAVARMWLLERSAEMNWRAAVTGTDLHELSEEEFLSWQAVSGEITGRIWAHLAAKTSAE